MAKIVRRLTAEEVASRAGGSANTLKRHLNNEIRSPIFEGVPEPVVRARGCPILWNEEAIDKWLGGEVRVGNPN